MCLKIDKRTGCLINGLRNRILYCLVDKSLVVYYARPWTCCESLWMSANLGRVAILRVEKNDVLVIFLGSTL